MEYVMDMASMVQLKCKSCHLGFYLSKQVSTSGNTRHITSTWYRAQNARLNI